MSESQLDPEKEELLKQVVEEELPKMKTDNLREMAT